MKKIRKFQYAGTISSPGLSTLSTNNLIPLFNLKPPTISPINVDYVAKFQDTFKDSWWNNGQNDSSTTTSNTINKTGNSIVASGIGAASNYLNGIFTDNIFGTDTELGRSMGTLFSSGLSSTTNTLADNLLKGNMLAQGLGVNAGASLAGAGAGIAANYIGKGITSAMGNSKAGKAIGAGVASGLGTVGGQAMSNLVKFGNFGKIFGKTAGAINPYGLAATVVGSALGAANGPSREYNGRYGKGVQIADTAYDAATVAVNAIPVAGLLISGFMTLNKGLSNLFGSTDGMTKQDAILGSAWMPAPVKWLNMAWSSKTGTFDNLSWQNSEKTNSFMGNAFGDLNDKLDKAREEAGKIYGTFSRKARNKALRNINFANSAWDNLLAMADLNEIQNIRSLLMTSINNQRYAQDIQGGWSPLARGKYGMKILNNATNHNIGMRLLSGAALVDSKQMILCGAID